MQSGVDRPLLAEGLSDAAVAQRLGISRHTARRHSERILNKLNLRSRAALAISLLRDGRGVDAGPEP